MTNTVRFRGLMMRLSPRETEVLKVIIAGPVSGYDLAVRVWGRHHLPVHSVVHVYISRLRKSLPKIALTIRGSGRSAYTIEALNAAQ